MKSRFYYIMKYAKKNVVQWNQVILLCKESKYNMYNESMISLQSVQQNHTFVVIQ